jgi:hypothetical protein
VGAAIIASGDNLQGEFNKTSLYAKREKGYEATFYINDEMIDEDGLCNKGPPSLLTQSMADEKRAYYHAGVVGVKTDFQNVASARY